MGREMRLEDRQVLDSTGFEMHPKNNGKPPRNFKPEYNRV